MERTYVQVNGVRLGVEQRGVGLRFIAPQRGVGFRFIGSQRGVGARFIAPQGGDEGPTTLVLLHGFTGSAAAWGHQLDTLADYGLRIIALDLLGHGQSDAPDDPQRYTIERCQQDILAALQALGVSKGQATILRYSTGRRSALYSPCSGSVLDVAL